MKNNSTMDRAIILFALLFAGLTASLQAQQWRIMAVGNSITAGKDGITLVEGNGFRKYLYDGLKASGIDFVMVGGRGNAPYNGHFVSGAKIDWFMSGGSMDIKNALDAYQPNIVLVHLGTNNTSDTQGPYTQDYTAAGKLRKLVNDQIAKDPNVKVILLCKILPKLDANYQEIAQIKQFNREIELMFFNNALSSKVIIVDMYSVLSPTRNDLPDGIHPIDAGYQKMALEYARVLKAAVRIDSSAPNPVDVISSAVSGEPAVVLDWYTPSDQGGGIVNMYELRYLIDQEITSTNFENGQVVYMNRPGRNNFVGGREQRRITEGVLAGRTYYFAIRVYDQANNRSTIRRFDPVTIPAQLAQAGIEFVDEFTSTGLKGWKAAPAYVAVNGVLKNTDAASAWKSLAVLDSIKYTPSAEYVKAGVRFATSSAYTDLSGTGIAMLLDSDDYRIASGYMIRVRDDIALYTIVNGQVLGNAISSAKPTSKPQKGDTLAVVYRNNPTANSFEVLKNGITIGTVQDTQKRYGKAARLYSGVMLYGSLNNEIDSYFLSIPQLEPNMMTIYGEPALFGEVDKKTGTPLSAKVVDINGVGVANVPVDFRVKSGVPAFLSADSVCQSFDGYLYLEAESGIIEAPMVKAIDQNASSGRYIYSKTFGSGKSIYAIWIPCTGSYDMILRVIAPDDNSNSVFWAIDDTTVYNRIDFPDKPAVWTWASRNRVSAIPLSEGFHKLYIKGREPNLRIDKILLTRYSGFTPQGQGGPPPRFANITDERGIVSTNVTFGNQAGQVVIEAYSDAVPQSNNLIEFPPIIVNAGTPSTFIAVSSLVIQGEAGRLLPEPFKVKVTDRYGNNRRGEMVVFQVQQGSGTFNGNSTQKSFTDESGIAEALLKLGFDNQTVVRAYLNDYPALEPILFTGAAETGTVPFTISNQTGATRFESAVNTRLRDSLRVRIVNQRGSPYRGYPVPFVVTRGDGKLNDLFASVIDTTDANGIAAVSWTIGRRAGVDSHQVQIKVPLNGSPITFTATALPDPPNELQLVSGNDQRQGAGKRFPAPLRVRIIDQYSNGIVNYRVRFTVVSGYGNFSNKLIGGSRDTTIVTDANGYAQVFYTAGSVAGDEQVKAEGAESRPLPLKNFRIFQLQVMPPLPQQLAIEAGNNQSQVVGFLLSQPFVVKVLNPFGNAMGAGIRVLFQVKEGNSTFNNAQSFETTTDVAGIARATMTLGTIAGVHKAIVSLPEFSDVAPIEFSATATPAAAAILKAMQPGNLRFSGQAGSGPIPITVQVTDLYGNPRPGQSVAFSVEAGAYFQTTGGNLKITQMTSDARGLASVNYMMGQQTGVLNVVKAAALKPGGEHLAGSPLIFEGTVLPGPPVSIRRIKEYSQAVPVRRTYPDSLIVELKDIHQNPVPEIDVLFTVRNRYGGNIYGNQQVNVSTNARGRAGVLYTMGSRAAAFSDTVLVSVPGYSLQSERILLTALPDDPYKISIVGDSTWVIKLGAGANAKSPTVIVTDAFDNPIAGIPVTFTVFSGNSTINGTTSFTTPTLNDGRASAPWLIRSTTPEQHLLSVSCEFRGAPLLFSPKLFRATVVAGDASKIVRVSPAVDRVDAVAKAAMTIVVAVQDAFGNGIANNPVKFSVSYPSTGERGFFVRYGQAVSDLQTTSNEQGFAQAIFYPIIGTNIITIGGGNDQPIPKIALNITGIPAKATLIRLLTPRQMQVTAGDSIAVRVEAYNAEGALVDGHPIDFAVIGNEGHLSNRFSINRKMTTMGFAEESWTVGTKVGVVNKLRISGGEGIKGSPDSILVTLRPSAPFAESSSVVITAPQGITADDDSKALVTVRLADRYDNPISGRRVRLTTESQFVLLEQPASETNSRGEAYGWLRATKTGLASVGATLQEDPTFRIAPAQVRVRAGKAAKIVLPEGSSDRFTVNMGAIVSRPLQVEVRDKYDNLVQPASAEVMFELQAGTGEFITPTGRVKTTSTLVDSNGRASVVYKAGGQAEICMIKAKLANPTVSGAELTLVGISRVPLTPYSIRKISGDSLKLPVGSLSSAPLVVQVLDAEGLPVWSGTAPTVQFRTLAGQIEFSGGLLASSDEFGRASKYFKLLAGGKHTIAAQVFGGEALVLFTATAQAGAPQRMAPAVTLHREATVASVQNNLLKVMIMDKDGNAVDGVPVLFQKLEEPVQANGAVVGSEPVITGSTGEAGVAAARLTLGEKAGEYIIRAISASVPGQSVTFTVHARADAAYYLSKHSGDYQIMTRGRRLVYPVVTRVTDRFLNPVGGVSVDFAPADSRSGSVALASVVSDSNGMAPNWWTIGSADENRLFFQKIGLKSWPAGTVTQFTAYGVDNRFPQFVGMRRDTTIVYGNPFVLQLRAVDEDGDALRYTMYAKPSTAVFNPTTALMTWTPSYNEIGVWTAKFRVDDSRTPSGFAVDSLRIQVISKIKIIDWSPVEGYLKIPETGSQQFCVTVTDQNPNSIVRYDWYVDDAKQPISNSCFTLNAAAFTKKLHTVKVVVNDGVSQDQRVWSIKVKVELTGFEATSLPFEGVRLDWKTSESGAMGFDVLRSSAKNGEYVKLNDELIKESGSAFAFIDTTATAGSTYFYKVEELDYNGIRTQSEPLMITVELPKEFMLLQNYPNPFNPKTAVRFQLPRPAKTKLVIFNLRGQEVKTLVNEHLEAGYHSVYWNGLNEENLQVASGIYYYRIQADEFTATKKMVLIR